MTSEKVGIMDYSDIELGTEDPVKSIQELYRRMYEVTGEYPTKMRIPKDMIRGILMNQNTVNLADSLLWHDFEEKVNQCLSLQSLIEILSKLFYPLGLAVNIEAV